MSRRLNFLCNLTNLKHDEMLFKFFQAQVDSPIKNDWIITVKENLNHLNINVTNEELEGKSKGQFKKEIKTKIHLAALKYLQDKASSHSKMEKLAYKKMSLQSYLYSNLISKSEAQQLFMFRTRMSMFANNFKNGATKLECPLCEVENSVDSEAHSVVCDTITDILPESASIDVTNIYSENINLMKEAIQILIQVMDLRRDIMST